MIAGVSDQLDGAATAEIRVAVADERRTIAEALAALIGTMPGFTVSAVVAGEADVCTIAAQPPDLVLAGVDPGSRAGFGLVREIRVRMPDVEIVIVTDAQQPDVVRLVFEQRMGGLLLTDMSALSIATSLDEIVHGHAVMPVGWQRMLADEQDDPVESLSERQLEVLRLLADGYSYEQIGARLFITLNTVKFHVRSIFVRLGVCNRTAAARVLAQRSLPAQARGHTASDRGGQQPPERVRQPRVRRGR
jgi:two-component system, NarL family, nitrate/nitrite response regulator NarP